MVRYGILMNVQSCLGCRTCMVSCKNQWGIPGGPTSTYQGRESYRIWPADLEQGKFPYVIRNETIMRCMQCQNPPCVDACPVAGALTQRPDGIVVVDPTKCSGCLYCVPACPYGAMYYRPDTNSADKCDLCAPLLDTGQSVPTCVAACLGEVMVFGDLSDPNSTISQMVKSSNATQLRPEQSTNPAVYFTAHFAVIHAKVVDDNGNPVTSPTPTLTDLATKTSVTTFLDSNGEFVFRRLTIGKTYSLTVAGTGYRPYALSSLPVTSEYQDLGTVTLYP